MIGRRAALLGGLALAVVPARFPAAAPDRAAALLARVNQERETRGLPALDPDPALTEAAQRHADDMAESGRFSHQGTDGSRLDDRVREAGYRFRAVAENIAAGQYPPERVVQGWLDSEEHREAMLNPTMREAGIGVARRGEGGGRLAGQLFWVLVLGRPL